VVKHVALSVVVLAAAMITRPLQAEEGGGAQRGLGLARQVCSECHAVQPQQVQSPNARAPTFVALATTPGMTSTALTVALTTPHAGMPMFRLSADQRQSIIDYVLGLKQEGSTPGK
jgi:mono/diheme cytochrome c family protein